MKFPLSGIAAKDRDCCTLWLTK